MKEASGMFCEVMSSSVSRDVEAGVSKGMLSDVVMGADTVLVGLCLLDFASILGVLLDKFLKL